jgi:hypothetical protein
MNQTFQNSAQVLSIGIFFSLMAIGLAATLPDTLFHGLQQHGVDAAAAHRASDAPPISVLFASFLGYNPAEHLLGTQTLAALPAHSSALIEGRAFFPHLILQPFEDGLHKAFLFAFAACLAAAAASWFRGGRYVEAEREPALNAVPAPADQTRTR